MVFSFPWDREILISSFQLIPQSFLFIHLWWFWRWIFVKICKIHWKLMIFKSQYCFANISATKAPIFMKFETYIHKIVKNYQKNFRKDLCTHARTRGVNMRARVSSRQNTRTHIYPSCARVFAWIFTKIFLMILNYLINISLKFHKDRSIRRGDICKTILSFKSYQFSMYFAYFNKYPPPKPSKMDNYWMTVEFIEN